MMQFTVSHPSSIWKKLPWYGNESSAFLLWQNCSSAPHAPRVLADLGKALAIPSRQMLGTAESYLHHIPNQYLKIICHSEWNRNSYTESQQQALATQFGDEFGQWAAPLFEHSVIFLLQGPDWDGIMLQAVGGDWALPDTISCRAKIFSCLGRRLSEQALIITRCQSFVMGFKSQLWILSFGSKSNATSQRVDFLRSFLRFLSFLFWLLLGRCRPCRTWPSTQSWYNCRIE